MPLEGRDSVAPVFRILLSTAAALQGLPPQEWPAFVHSRQQQRKSQAAAKAASPPDSPHRLRHASSKQRSLQGPSPLNVTARVSQSGSLGQTGIDRNLWRPPSTPSRCPLHRSSSSGPRVTSRWKSSFPQKTRVGATPAYRRTQWTVPGRRPRTATRLLSTSCTRGTPPPQPPTPPMPPLVLLLAAMQRPAARRAPQSAVGSCWRRRACRTASLGPTHTSCPSRRSTSVS